MTKIEMMDRLTMKIPAFAAKVAPIYAVLGWKWRRENDGTGGFIPTAVQIEAELIRLSESVRKPDCGQCRTGGLSVWCEENAESGSGMEAGMDMTISTEIYE